MQYSSNAFKYKRHAVALCSTLHNHQVLHRLCFAKTLATLSLKRQSIKTIHYAFHHCLRSARRSFSWSGRSHLQLPCSTRHGLQLRHCRSWCSRVRTLVYNTRYTHTNFVTWQHSRHLRWPVGQPQAVCRLYWCWYRSLRGDRRWRTGLALHEWRKLQPWNG